MAQVVNNFDLNCFPDELLAFEESPNSEMSFDLNIPPIEEEIQATNDLTSESHDGRRKISNDERRRIYEALLVRSVNGKLKKNTTNEVASLFSVPLRSVQRIWKRAKETPSGTAIDVSLRQPKNCGRKRIEFDLSVIANIPLSNRKTLRSLADVLHMNHVTLHSRFKEGSLRRHSSVIKPYLKVENKMTHLRFCISMLEPSSLPQEPTFRSMYNYVHIDEKWFYITEKSNVYYLLPKEEDPERTCQIKNFRGKVMFLVAIARPRFDVEGNEIFSGKIGVFPLVTTHAARRNSSLRPAGTMETRPITVTQAVSRKFLVEHVIPAIQAKWPRDDTGSTIFIQQDNAKTHVQPNDAEFQRAASQTDFDIRLTCQLPNSPDMNVLDLGFFNAIQSLQQKVHTKTVGELILAVQGAFEAYPTNKINRVLLSFQLCMIETMKAQGSNRYKIPHINKERLERNGCLPTTLTCDRSLVESVMNTLNQI